MVPDPEYSQLTISLLKIQKNVGALKKSSNNPFFKSKYADLNEALSVVKPLLDTEELLLLQPCGKDAFGHYVATEIRNKTGEAVSCRVYLTDPVDMQKLGAAITYARRYGLKSLLALEDEDDDGNTATGKRQPETTTITVHEVAELIKKLPAEKGKVAMQHLAAAGSDQDKLKKVMTTVAARLAMKEMP